MAGRGATHRTSASATLQSAQVLSRQALAVAIVAPLRFLHDSGTVLAKSRAASEKGGRPELARPIMPYGLYLSADGAHAQSTRLEAIANNLANVDTVGFKRELAVFQARYAQAVAEGRQAPGNGAVEDVGGGTMVRQTKTDYSSGPMKRTDAPADVAIDGDAFFLVQKDGETFLTRAGNFRVAAGGELLTQQGYPVLGDDRSPITISPGNGPWQITPTGAVRQRGTSQNLALVRPASLGDLVKAGENLFRPLADPEPVPAAQRRVAPGYLELSAVQPIREMTEMIEASRALEANLNMMKAQDQMLGNLVARVLKV